jgi:hypothetical protein
MSVGTLLIIVLILMLVGAFPAWPYSRNWGYSPAGIILVILILLILLGRL